MTETRFRRKFVVSTSTTTTTTRLFFLAALLLVSCLPIVSGQSCIDNLEDIYEKESFVTDTSFPRLYVVCPRRIYEIGSLDFDGSLIQPKGNTMGTVSPPLPLRPNMTIRCGDQGSRENLCWLKGGDLHADGTKIRGISDETLENVRIEGFVFIGAREHVLMANKPGSITFRDCEFREITNSSAPIMLDYYDATDPSSELVATFLDCEFKENRYFGMGSQSALIYGNSDQNRIEVESSLFENNDMVWNNTRPDTHSYIIESLGPVVVKKSCFLDNFVGASDVVVFGNAFHQDLNFVRNSSGALCPFAAVFETVDQFDAFTPRCISSASIACNRYVTSSPTLSPSEGPTESPRPSDAPSSTPTISDSPTITPVPTGVPSVSPSGVPTKEGTTRSPSEEPSEEPLDFFWPTILLTEAPASAAVATSLSLGRLCVVLAVATFVAMLSSCLVL